LIALPFLLTCLSLNAVDPVEAAKSGSPELKDMKVIRNYRKARDELLEGKAAGCEHARDLLKRDRTPGYYREGEFRTWYFPSLLRGLVFEICDKNYASAKDQYDQELSQGLVSQSPEDLSILKERRQIIANLDFTAPDIHDLKEEVVDISWDGGQEKAEIEISGQVSDDRAVGSVLVGDSVADLTPDRLNPRSVRFEAHLEDIRVTEPMTPIRVEARDTSKNSKVQIIDHLLPPIHVAGAENTYGLVVGIDSYDHSYRKSADGDCLEQYKHSCRKDAIFQCYSLPKLTAAVADANRFYGLLIRRGVPPKNVRLLVSDPDGSHGPTKQEILEELGRLTQHSGRRLFFYFSGHGSSSKERGDLLLPWDSRPMECRSDKEVVSSEMEATALSSKDIERTLNRSTYEERYLIMDACRTPPVQSTKAAQDASSATENLLPPVNPHPRGVGVPQDPEPKVGYTLVFYPTIDGKVSLEWSQKKAGFFTYYLVQGLRRDLSIYELSDYLNTNVEKQSALHNCPDGKISDRCALIQRPYIWVPDIQLPYVRNMVPMGGP
jgi:Caspase domain.